jgi:hypothetical protein
MHMLKKQVHIETAPGEDFTLEVEVPVTAASENASPLVKSASTFAE